MDSLWNFFVLLLIFDICVIVCMRKETHKILSHVFTVNIIPLLIQPDCIAQTLSTLKATPVQILLVTPYKTYAHHTSIARFLRFSTINTCIQWLTAHWHWSLCNKMTESTETRTSDTSYSLSVWLILASKYTTAHNRTHNWHCTCTHIA